MTIGESIRKARKERGLTQAELAERLGITQPNLARYESDKRVPKLSTLQRIAAALGVPIRNLLLPQEEIIAYDTGADFDKAWNEMIEDSRKAAAEEQERLEQLTTSFKQLNSTGQEEALKRVSEMAEMPKYRKGRELVIAHGVEERTTTERVTGEQTKEKRNG